LRTWMLEEHFEVTADGHVGCKVCTAHREWEKTQGKTQKKRGEKARWKNSVSEGKFDSRECRNVRWSLTKHLTGSKHRAARKARAEEEDDSVPDDVPTDAQMYFTYDIVKKNPVAGGAPQYQERCREARAAGDLSNVPAFRCSAPVFHQNVHSIHDAVKMQTRSSSVRRTQSSSCAGQKTLANSLNR